MIVIGGKGYELMLDHKDGWNPEAFRGRYSEVLDRYDYIIGDWGYSQLRLKGFYRDNHPKVNRDTAISGMVDYINEYCNFGCAYFVLHKLKESPQEGSFKDILIKEIPEPELDEDLEQDAEQVVTVKEHREPQTKGAGREHVTKDRPVREHQSRNHRNKEGQGKKNHKEFQGRGQQGQPNNVRQNREHKDNHSNRSNKQANQNKQDRPEKQDNQSRQDSNQNKQDN
ncbi:YutD family protein [Paenibacillus sp. FSL R7-277]|uniref:YutD family protein n=1 Tax=Paenibacillus sp. FSL R7-277 TaxID=1227352 RepID=UPI0004AE02F8|nr:YutD family protein [Paenibacillus sp. FSL R7-277]